MKPEALHYFLEIANVGSFSSAARRLCISQQGLSKSIQLLEKELGVELFENSGRNIRLSAAGHELMPLAKAWLDDYQHMKNAMQRYAKNSRCSDDIKVLATAYTANTFFCHLRESLNTHMLLNTTIEEKECLQVLREIADPTCSSNVGIIAIESNGSPLEQPDYTDIVFEPLLISVIGISGTRDLISPQRQQIPMKEVSQLPIACYVDSTLDSMIRDITKAHPLDRIVVRTSSLPIIDEYVQSGRSITFWDSFDSFLMTDSDATLFVPIAEALPFQVGFVYSKQKGLTSLEEDYIKRFKECIAETCKPYLRKHPIEH